MRFQKMNLLTGAMLSVAISTVSVFPAFAKPVVPSVSGQAISQTMDNMVMGTVRNITDDMITVEMSDGTTKDIRMMPEDIQRLNLQPGMKISAMLDAQNMASDVKLMTEDLATTDTTNRTASSTQEEVIQRRRVTTQRTTTPAPTTDTSEESTTPVENTTQARPVRALW